MKDIFTRIFVAFINFFSIAILIKCAQNKLQPHRLGLVFVVIVYFITIFLLVLGDGNENN